MESEQQALLRTIRHAPDDVAPRLIYADWLDEHDEPDIAEMIRIGVSLRELRRTARTSSEYMDIAQIETTLRYALMRRFTCGTAALVHTSRCATCGAAYPTYASRCAVCGTEAAIDTHGLFHTATVYRDQLRAFVPYLPSLVAMFPITRLEIHGARLTAIQSLLEQPDLLTIQQLVLKMECDDITSIARCIGDCPHLDGLTRLELREHYTLIGRHRIDFPNDLQVVSDAEKERLRARFGAALVWVTPTRWE